MANRQALNVIHRESANAFLTFLPVNDIVGDKSPSDEEPELLVKTARLLDLRLDDLDYFD